MELIKYITFTSILFYIPMWSQINLFLSSLGKNKKSVELIKDEWIIKVLKEKTGTNISNIKIFNSNLFFGMMAGIPNIPQLILSRKLYKSFSKDELEYVILHEAGHYKLRHSAIELSVGLAFLTFGLSFLRTFSTTFVVANILAISLGILMIQFGRLNEIQADHYSLRRMKNPKGMITATNKFEKAWKDKSSKNLLVRILFYRGNPYENRIRMAKMEIQNRLSK